MGYTTEHLPTEPAYSLVVDGRNITPRIEARLMSLTLTEERGGSADQLDLELDDSDGALQLPAKGAVIALQLGWAGQLVDKGTFTVDEVEHSGAPDRITVRARSADMRKPMRTRAEHSYHATTLGEIVTAIAQRNKLTPRIDPRLATVKVEHVDQTHESDLHFCTRLASQHDAVCTVKKGHLLFLPVQDTRTSSGQPLRAVTITRGQGDQHRYHTADRAAYSGVRAYWQDPDTAQRRSALVGTEENEKRLKDTYGSEADALAAARAERQRVERGTATFEITLALGRAELAAQTPVAVRGFKGEIDSTPWRIKKLTHTLGYSGLTTHLELEMQGSTAEGPDD